MNKCAKFDVDTTSSYRLTNFSFELCNAVFTQDASLFFLYHGANKKKVNKTKSSNQGVPLESRDENFARACVHTLSPLHELSHQH